ncbi:hypothetical protein BT69DRAFT_1329845 [Atractiella rhizophila]|nr:hypothetical protein BT69DRAFT_1329845 [Atractiella rhizophila]
MPVKDEAEPNELQKEVSDLKAEVERLKKEMGTKNEVLHKQTTLLANLQTTLNCPICLEVLVRPHALTCGHIFCASCLSQWFHRSSSRPGTPDENGRQRVNRKRNLICPSCRAQCHKYPPLKLPLLIDLAHTLRPHRGNPLLGGDLADVGEGQDGEEKVQGEQDATWGGLWVGARDEEVVSKIRDEEDGVFRCTGCSWEVSERAGRCPQCGRTFAGGGDNDSDASTYEDEDYLSDEGGVWPGIDPLDADAYYDEDFLSDGEVENESWESDSRDEHSPTICLCQNCYPYMSEGDLDDMSDMSDDDSHFQSSSQSESESSIRAISPPATAHSGNEGDDGASVRRSDNRIQATEHESRREENSDDSEPPIAPRGWRRRIPEDEEGEEEEEEGDYDAKVARWRESEEGIESDEDDRRGGEQEEEEEERYDLEESADEEDSAVEESGDDSYFLQQYDNEDSD